MCIRDRKYTDKQDKSSLEAGFMWQKLHRTSEKYGLQSEILSFVTVKGDAEVHLVKITNIEEEEQEITPVAVIPVYGRSADNLRDHRHVTSLLHRIRTCLLYTSQDFTYSVPSVSSFTRLFL